MPPSDELIITLLAILKTGAAYLPIDVNFPKNNIYHILRDAKPALVIYDNNAIDCVAFSNIVTFSFTECKNLSAINDNTNIPDAHQLESTIDDHLAVVIYTSGTTGMPKGDYKFIILTKNRCFVLFYSPKKNLKFTFASKVFDYFTPYS